MKRGDILQAFYGRVRVSGFRKNGVAVIYVDGIFKGREALIEKRWLRDGRNTQNPVPAGETLPR